MEKQHRDMQRWLSRNRGFAGIMLGMALVALHVYVSRLIAFDEEASAQLDELEAQAAAHEQEKKQIRASRAAAAAHPIAGESA